MVEYPFNEARAVIDKEGFDLLKNYFEFSSNDITNNFNGIRIFKWPHDLKQFEQLSLKEFCHLSFYVLTYGYLIYEPNNSLSNNYSTRIWLDLMKERGINREIFLNYSEDLELKIIGTESAQILSAVVHDLDLLKKDVSDYDLLSDSLHLSFDRFRNNFKENSKQINVCNQGKDCPFTLDEVINFENEPACLRYSDDGHLYVLDTQLVLHKFNDAEKIDEWSLLSEKDLQGLPKDFPVISSINNINLGDKNLLPNLAVMDNYVFITNGDLFSTHSNILRYDLRKKNQSKIAFDQSITSPGIFFEDVVIKDGNVLISGSSDYYRFIQQVRFDAQIQTKEIYRGRLPVGFVENTSDSTLRMDVHEGNLFFPRGTGISLYRGKSPNGEKPKEMLSAYVSDTNLYASITPITKFSFGNDFMVAQALLKDFKMPLICIFKPKYEARNGQELVSKNQFFAPDNLILDYVTFPPNFTTATLRNSSLSAYRNKFAITNSSFKRVYLYHLH